MVDSVYPALLKYWRQQRGLSQLDFGLTADVSPRHISFLETGRSQPSVEMVMQLAETLDVPLRDRNEMLRGAGFDARYPEPGIADLLDGPMGVVIDTMLSHHDPYPMFVFDRLYNVVRCNAGGSMFLVMAGVDDPVGSNLMRLIFSKQARSLITNWSEVAGELLRRAQREAMHNPNDEELAALVANLLDQPRIPDDWRTPNLALESGPAIGLEANLGDGIELSFLATITAFSSPSNVTLDELRVESYLPLDEATRSFFTARAE